MAEPTASQEPASSDDTEAPFLRVVRGDATREEVAAIVAVLASLQPPVGPAKRRVPAWSAPHRGVRRTLPHGAGGWRASGLPR